MQRQARGVVTIEHGAELRQSRRNIADHIGRDRVVLIDLGWQEIDVDDLLIARGIPELRAVFDEVVADHQHDIGRGHRLVAVVPGLQTDGEQVVLIRAGQRTLAHERVEHRQAGLVRQLA